MTATCPFVVDKIRIGIVGALENLSSLVILLQVNGCSPRCFFMSFSNSALDVSMVGGSH